MARTALARGLLWLLGCLADVVATTAATVIREVWLLASQVLNLVAALILHFIHSPGHYLETGTKAFRHVASHGSMSSDLPPEDEDEADDGQAPQRRFTTLVRNWRLRVIRIGRVFRPPISPFHDIRSSPLNFHDKIASGILEDIQLALLSIIEDWRLGVHDHLLDSFEPGRFLRRLQVSLRRLHPSALLNPATVDTRTVREMVCGMGYPYESHSVTTEDGFSLCLERIARPDSRSVVFFQHGVLDSSFGWVSCGNTGSVAFLAFEQGHDVFLGNLRGNGPSYNRPEGMPNSQYWNFTLNEHAFYDLGGCIDKVVEIKRRELGEEVDVSVVAHSLGGAAVLAYMVHRKLRCRPHHVRQAILLSPAGAHAKIPRFCQWTGGPIIVIAKLLRLTHIKISPKWLQILIVKLLKDVHDHPAARHLMCTFASRYLLGGDAKYFPLHYVHNLTYNMLQAGTSLNVHRHFWQIYKRHRFQAYDYGPAENIVRYGSSRPIDFMQHYNLIDVPVTLIAGRDDTLIPAADVVEHYHAFRRYPNAKVRWKSFNCGHVDLLMGMTEDVLAYVCGLLGTPKTPDLPQDFTSPPTSPRL
eukprot:TRINITY_DN22462_c0_g1_i1.p1 TRINITY_DN22462_c0_g1~~TRINITY_DN22462_c0_g1_i1.p1  ORF type:complete len:600 (+),score=109.99 TRINITY_DN22462_c0_g1_i1:51-1802(+)